MSESANPESVSVEAKKPRRKRIFFLVTGILGGAFILALLGLRMYFSDAYFKELLESKLQEALNGRPTTISRLELSLLSGRVKLEGLRVAQTDPAFKDRELFSLERAEIVCGLWPLLTSGGTRIEALDVRLQKPRLTLERQWVGETIRTNVDDLIKRYTGGEWPMKTGLESASGKLGLIDGAILVRDSTPGMRDCSLEEIRLDADLPALGKPLAAQLELLLKTPDVEKGGRASLKAQLVAIDSAGTIDPALLKDISINADLKEFDAAHLARYADLKRSLMEGKYEGTLGRPVNGTVALKAPSIRKAHLTADLETGGLIAVWEKAKRVADNLPARLNIDASVLAEDGALKIGPMKTNFTLAGSNAELAKTDNPRCLTLDITASAPGAAGQDVVINVKGALDDLFATDVGRILALQERLGGAVDGAFKLNLSNDRGVKLDAHLTINPTEEQKSLPTVKIALNGSVGMNEAGVPRQADLTVQAQSDFAEIRSRKPIKLRSLDDPAKLDAEADLYFTLRGKAFWKAFGPLLSVAGIDKPIAEKITGTLKIAGEAGKADAALSGRMTRESGAPEPILFNVAANYNAAALNASPGGARSPYLGVSLQLKSEADTSLNVLIKGQTTRKKAVTPADNVRQALADLDDVNAHAFVARTAVRRLQDMGLLTNEPLLAGDLRLKTRFDGSTGQLHVTQLFLKGDNVDLNGVVQKLDVKRILDLKPDVPWAKRIAVLPALALRVHVKEPAIRRLQALGVLTGQKALHGDWDLNAGYDPTTGSLRLDRVHFEGPAGGVTISAPAIKAGSLAAFLDAEDSRAASAHLLADCTLQVKANPKLFEALRDLPSIPDDLPVSGDLLMNMRYVRNNDRLFMDIFRFQSRKGSRSPLTFLEMSFEVAQVAKLLRQQPQEPVAYLPHLNKGFHMKSVKLLPEEAFAYVMKQGSLKGLPAIPPLDGPLELQARYETAEDRMVLQRLKYDRREGSKAPVIALELTGAVLGVQKLLTKFPDDLAGYLNHVGKHIAIKRLGIAPEAAFSYLKAMKLALPLPDESPLAGDCEIRASYDRQKDRVVLETIAYQRRKGSSAPVIDLKLGLEVARIRDLLENTPKSAADILPHLDKGVLLQTLSLSPSDAIAFLKRNGYKTAYLDMVHPKGPYRPLGPFVVKDLKITPPDVPDGYKVSFLAQTPVAVHPVSAPGKPPAGEPSTIFSGPWGFAAGSPLELLPAPDRLVFQGKLRLDDARVYCADGKPYFIYEKKAGATSLLALKGAIGRDGSAILDKLALSGGPVAFSASGLKVGAGPQAAVSLGSFSLTEGPLKMDLKDVLFDPARDRLRLTADLKTLDVARARQYASLPSTVRVSGTLRKCVLGYDGRQSVLTTGAFGPKDAFSLQALANDLMLTTQKGPKTYAFTVNGGLVANNARVSSKALVLGLDRSVGTGTTFPLELMIPLDISATKAGVPVLTALMEPGMPITVKAPVRATSAVRIDVLLEALESLGGDAAPGKPAKGGGLESIRRLRLESGVSAPSVSYEGLVINDLQAPALVLSNGNLSIPSVKATAYRGAVQLSKAAYQLLVDPIQHTQAFALRTLHLRPLTMGPRGKDETKIFGTLSADGALAGTGFAGQERRSWNGKINLVIKDLVIKNSPKSGIANFAKDTFKNLLLETAGGFLGIGGSGRTRYFNEFLKEMAFQPIEIASDIKQGKLTIPRTLLTGTGPSEGFQADIVGGVNLASERFSPPINIRVLKLSPLLQKAFKLDRLDEPDRKTVLDEFAQGKFTPLVIDGKSSDPNYIKRSNGKFLLELSTLQARIDRMIADKEKRERQATSPGESGQKPDGQGKTADADPPKKKKKKKRGWEEIIGRIPDILKGGDKKEPEE